MLDILARLKKRGINAAVKPASYVEEFFLTVTGDRDRTTELLNTIGYHLPANTSLSLNDDGIELRAIRH